MTKLSSRFGPFLVASSIAVVLAPFAAGCGNGDDDDHAAADAGTDSGIPIGTLPTGITYEVGCDATLDHVHTCIDYQYLTADQQTTLQASCTTMGGAAVLHTIADANTDTFEACSDDNEVGSCEVATGNNIKQVTSYYSDDGYTQAQAQAACTAANGDFAQ